VVKVLRDPQQGKSGARERFLREAQLTSQLDHPYAAHVYAFGAEPDGVLWIAMEMVPGISLDTWLRERGPMPPEQFAPFFNCVAKVVAAAHERGIIHRDLKPANVMVIERSGGLIPKLLDFGIAKANHGAACLSLDPLVAHVKPQLPADGIVTNPDPSARDWHLTPSESRRMARWSSPAAATGFSGSGRPAAPSSYGRFRRTRSVSSGFTSTAAIS
jgi:serine/threonine protein kinase